MVSVPLGVWCVEWRWCALLLACTVQWCSPRSAYPSAVLMSTAVVSRTVLLPSGVVCVVCVSVHTPLCGGVSCVCSSPVAVVGGAVVDGWVAW